jgi:hypothetical protein
MWLRVRCIEVRKDRYRKESNEVSLARTNNFLGIYGGLVSMCLGMSGIASRMEQDPRRLALGDGLARERPRPDSQTRDGRVGRDGRCCVGTGQAAGAVDWLRVDTSSPVQAIVSRVLAAISG